MASRRTPAWVTAAVLMLLTGPALGQESRAGMASGPTFAQAAAADRTPEPVGATGAGPLTLERAAALAINRYPAVGVAAAARDQARAAVGESQAAWFPSVRLSGSGVRYEEPMAVAPIHGFSLLQPPLFDDTPLQASGSISYTLFDGAGRPARVRQARRRAEAATSALTAAEQATVARVVVTYLDVLARREVLAAHDQRLIALGAEQDRVGRLVETGREADERARLSEIDLRQEVDRAAGVVDEVRARLSSLRTAVASYAEVARIEQLSLESGAGTQTDYLQAEADLLAARASLAEARYREIAARIDLARVAGTLTLEWLSRALEVKS